jgi:hypothetical protein
LRFALRMGKIIDVIKGLHFIIYVWHVMESDIEEDFFFCFVLQTYWW